MSIIINSEVLSDNYERIELRVNGWYSAMFAPRGDENYRFHGKITTSTRRDDNGTYWFVIDIKSRRAL